MLSQRAPSPMSGRLGHCRRSNTYTYTSTSTRAFSTPKDNVDIGLGFGRAVACRGSSSDTEIQTAHYAKGDKDIANSIVHDHALRGFLSHMELQRLLRWTFRPSNKLKASTGRKLEPIKQKLHRGSQAEISRGL
jgi:hypothetical protein